MNEQNLPCWKLIPDEIKDRLTTKLKANDPIPVLKEIKPYIDICSDCNKFLKDSRKIHHKKCFKISPHWRSRCTNCNLWKHPVTNEYTLTQHQATLAFQAVLRTKDK